MAAFLGLLRRSLGWRLGWTVAVGLAASLSAGLGLLALLPMLGAVGIDVGGGAGGRIAGATLALLRRLGLPASVPVVLGLNALLATLSALLARSQAVLTTALYQRFVLRCRADLFEALTEADWRYLVRQRHASLSHVLIGETERLGAAALSVTGLVTKTAMVLAYAAVAVVLSPVTTALAGAAAALVALAAQPMTRRARRRGRAVSEAYERLYGVIGEHLAGLKTIKGHGLEREQLTLLRRRAEATERAMVGVTRTQADAALVLQVGSAVVLGAAVYVALVVARVPVATLLVLVYAFARLVPMMTGLQRGYQQFVGDLPAFERFEAARLAAAAAAEDAAEAPAPGQGGEPPRLRHELALRGVRFAYAPEEPEVLRGVDLAIPAGRTVALVGPSGSGKSTVVDLVLGLVAPTEGTVELDGRPLRERRRRAWRRQVGFVPQDVFLFHDTIRTNLLVARPEADEADLRRALEDAAAGFVFDLPDGLDTVVGERGTRLSGGERQRLALARALLRRPTLLVLDEATSNLDSENEARILEAIERLRGSVTLVVVAHRLATVRGADVLYVLEEGRVVERGSWDALVGRDGRLSAMARAQGIDARPARSPTP